MRRITVVAPGFANPFVSEPKEFSKGKPTYFTVNMNEFNVPTVKEVKSKATA